MRMCDGGKHAAAQADLESAIRPALLDVFPAALLGRMTLVPYYPLGDSMLGRIARLQLDRVASRVLGQYGAPFNYDDAVVDLIRSRCTEVESGGRMIDGIINGSLLPLISRGLLERTLEGTKVGSVDVSVKDGGFEVTLGD